MAKLEFGSEKKKSGIGKKPKGPKRSVALTRALMAPMMKKAMKGAY